MALADEIDQRAQLTPRERELLQQTRDGQPPVDLPGLMSQTDAIFQAAGFTPPSANGGAQPDLAAALQRASYDPAHAPNFPELPPGTGIAMGPTGFATAGMTSIPDNPPPDYRGNITAPPPPSEQDVREQQMLKAATDAQKGNPDAAVTLKYLEMQNIRELVKGGASYPEAVLRSRVFTSTPAEEAAMAKAIPAQVKPPTALNIPGIPPGVVAGGRPYWPPAPLVNPPGTTETAFQKDQMAMKRTQAEESDRKARREEILKQMTSNSMLLAALDAGKAETDKALTPERKAQRKRYLDLQREYDTLKESAAPPAPAPAPPLQPPAMAAAPGTNAPAVTPVNGEVRRVTKDGRVAIYDANKRFIRYVD